MSQYILFVFCYYVQEGNEVHFDHKQLQAQAELEKQAQALASQGANAKGGAPDEALIQKLQEMTMRCADLEMKLSQGSSGTAGGADEAEINRLLDIMADLEQEKAKMQKHIQELTECVFTIAVIFFLCSMWYTWRPIDIIPDSYFILITKYITNLFELL